MFGRKCNHVFSTSWYAHKKDYFFLEEKKYLSQFFPCHLRLKRHATKTGIVQRWGPLAANNEDLRTTQLRLTVRKAQMSIKTEGKHYPEGGRGGGCGKLLLNTE
jgi:hypothetical protein